MYFIGITGGVGAGKSLILDYLKNNYNCKIILADDLAKELMQPGTKLFDDLKQAFGAYDVWQENGDIDRKAMASVIFSDSLLLEEMNSIVHPAVKEAVAEMVENERNKGEIDYFFLEAAVLIEDNYEVLCDELWYIYTSEDNRRIRLKSSRGYSDERIDSMLASQLSEEEFREGCDFVIDNNGSEEDVYAQLDAKLISGEITLKSRQA